MICYRDITLCEFYKNCKNGKKCDRALTDKIKQEAKEWMGKHAPIARFVDKPKCWEKDYD